MIDRDLLRIMKYKKDFGLLFPLIPQTAIDKETQVLLGDFKKWFEQNKEATKIDFANFIPRFNQWHHALKPEKLAAYTNVFKQVIPDVSDEVRSNIVAEISEIEMVTKLADIAQMHAEGEVPNLYTSVSSVMDDFKRRIGVKEQKFIDTPISELLQKEFDNAGLRWRLDALNGSMRRLRPGDFGIIAGRPDKGKTSFIASEVTYLGPQLPPEQNVLWLNNEGPGERIIPRLYQAALNLTMTDMKLQATTLEDRYRALMGRLDKIRIFDIHGWTNSQVEILIESNNAGLVIFDMIDNIKGFGDAARTDLALEHMYQWARERCVKYDCIGLATSQISADGDGLMYPTLNMLKDSKTGKQGACDFQLMIGASNDPGFATQRFLSLPKNKLRKPDGPADPRCAVEFDANRSRYNDLGMTLTEEELPQ